MARPRHHNRQKSTLGNHHAAQDTTIMMMGGDRTTKRARGTPVQHLEGVQVFCRTQQLAEQALGLILRHASRPPVPRTPCHTVELRDDPICFGAARCPVGLSSWQNRRSASSCGMPPDRMCQRQPCQGCGQYTVLIVQAFVSIQTLAAGKEAGPILWHACLHTACAKTAGSGVRMEEKRAAHGGIARWTVHLWHRFLSRRLLSVE